MHKVLINIMNLEILKSKIVLKIVLTNKFKHFYRLTEFDRVNLKIDLNV